MKKFLQKLLSSKKNRLLIMLAVFLLGSLYLLILMLSVSGSELCLEDLRRSFEEEKICHEDCSVQREKSSLELIGGLADNPDSKAAKRLEDYFLDEDSDLDFRIALIDIISRSAGNDNPPDYIKEYLRGGANAPVRAAILSSFTASALSSEINPLDYYYKILAGQEELAVKLAVIRVLSSLNDKKEYLDSGQLELIKGIIFNSGTDKRLRQPLILLLSDYYLFFPDEAKGLLSAYYLTASDGDTISRAFAADSLNRLGEDEYIVPEVSPEEWDEYYND